MLCEICGNFLCGIDYEKDKMRDEFLPANNTSLDRLDFHVDQNFGQQ